MTRRRWPSPASTATASGTEFCKCRSRPTKHTRPEPRPHGRPGREKRAHLSTSVKISFVNQCYEEKAYLASNNVIPLLCFGFLPVADDHLTCFPSYGYVWCFFFFFSFLRFFYVLASRVGVFFLQCSAGNLFAVSFCICWFSVGCIMLLIVKFKRIKDKKDS